MCNGLDTSTGKLEDTRRLEALRTTPAWNQEKQEYVCCRILASPSCTIGMELFRGQCWAVRPIPDRRLSENKLLVWYVIHLQNQRR